jgi:hypothetical protein
LLAQYGGILAPPAQAPPEPPLGMFVYPNHQTLISGSLLGNDAHYDAGGKDDDQDDGQLVQSLIRAAPAA